MSTAGTGRPRRLKIPKRFCESRDKVNAGPAIFSKKQAPGCPVSLRSNDVSLTVDCCHGPTPREQRKTGDTMNKYLLLYRSPVANTEYQPSAEEMQQMLAQWESWKQKFKAAVLDMGDGLKPTGRVLKDGVVSDGPHIESKEVLGGFSIVQAETYEQALEVAKECPVLHMPGARIEIREMMGY